MNKASLIHVSKDFIHIVNKELCSFILNGNDNVRRLALINDIERRELKTLGIESLILTQRMICMKRYGENYTSPWKIFLSHYLKEFRSKFTLLQCNFGHKFESFSMQITESNSSIL